MRLFKSSTAINSTFVGAAFTCGVEKVVVPFFNKGMPVEYELVRSISTVAQPKRRKLAVVTTDVNLSGGFSFAGGQVQQLPKQAILEELEREFTVENVDITTPLAVYDEDGKPEKTACKDPKAYDEGSC